MYISSLYLQQFRNYKEAHFTFDPSLNIICGSNAQGKTNLLEAIYYLMIGRSFRPGHPKDIIQYQENFCFLEITFYKHEIKQKLNITLQQLERKIVHNSTSLTSALNLLGLIPGVVITPDEINLIKGAPCLRRQFLDLQIAQTDPLYVHYSTRYAKAMRQRNLLLKQKKKETLEIWEHEMAQAASYIVWQRRKLIRDLLPYCQIFYTHLAKEKETICFHYQNQATAFLTEQEIKHFYLQQYQINQSKEMIVGHTLYGPHKDDLWIGIGEHEARFFASEGQKYSCTLALQMGEWQRLKTICEDSPILMIDDIGISLDKERHQRLMEYLANVGQVFLTTTQPNFVNEYTRSKKIISISKEESL